MEIGVGNEGEPSLWDALACEEGFAWELAEDFGEGIIKEVVDGGVGYGGMVIRWWWGYGSSHGLISREENGLSCIKWYEDLIGSYFETLKFC